MRARRWRGRRRGRPARPATRPGRPRPRRHRAAPRCRARCRARPRARPRRPHRGPCRCPGGHRWPSPRSSGAPSLDMDLRPRSRDRSDNGRLSRVSAAQAEVTRCVAHDDRIEADPPAGDGPEQGRLP
ncbi:hypothetical protein DMP15_29450 [Pseudonocardia sp. UM4_GMWB1]